MLGLPYLFMKAGWIGGFTVCAIFAGCVWRTSIIMGRELNGDPRPTDFFDDYFNIAPPGSSPSARMTKPLKSFPEMARAHFGTTGTIVLSIILYFELFSCLSIYFVSIGDHLHALYPSISTQQLTLYTAFIVVIPAIFLRTPRLLSYLSLVGTVSTIFIVVAVVASAVLEGNISDGVAKSKGILPDGPGYILWDTSGLPLALGMIGFCFSGHAIVPSLANAMERPQDYEKMIHVTFTIVITACFLVAASGYYMFGAMVDDQITISLEVSSHNPAWAMTLLTWLMILTQFSKFVLTLFPLSLGMEEIFASLIHSEQGMALASAVIKLVYIILAFGVAFYVPSFSFICTLVGLICTMIVSVIFPAAVHIKMFGPKLSFMDKFFDWFLVIGGLFAACVGTIAIIT